MHARPWSQLAMTGPGEGNVIGFAHSCSDHALKSLTGVSTVSRRQRSCVPPADGASWKGEASAHLRDVLLAADRERRQDGGPPVALALHVRQGCHANQLAHRRTSRGANDLRPGRACAFRVLGVWAIQGIAGS